MLSRPLRRLTYSNVIATVALFIALGGTSVAALRISSRQIKDGSVTGTDIKNHTIRHVDIGGNTLKPLKTSARQVTRPAGPSGVPPSSAYTTVATLFDLKPGHYVILAKTNQSATRQDSGKCRLTAGRDSDESSRGLRSTGTADAHNVQVVHSFTSAGSVTLACRSGLGPWSAYDSKIVALKLAAATSAQVSG